MVQATSKAWGFFLAIIKSLRAACGGRRVSCSQLRTEFGLTGAIKSNRILVHVFTIRVLDLS